MCEGVHREHPGSRVQGFGVADSSPGLGFWGDGSGPGFSGHGNVHRFLGGLVYMAHRLCASLISKLESNKEEGSLEFGVRGCYRGRTWPRIGTWCVV